MKLTCETATLADAVNRAARVAPSKGAAFHKAAGLLFEVNIHPEERLVLRATDLEVTYRQSVAVLDAGAEEVTWRISAGLLAGILNTLPMGEGSTVTLEDAGKDTIVIKSGKKRAKLHMIVGDFPPFGRFDHAGMIEVDNFAQRVTQVAWACDKDTAPYSGVHIDGERLIATDKSKVALVPCKVPVDKPLTVPLGPLMGLLKNTSAVALRAEKNRLHLMPDQDTQASTIIYANEYPPIDRALRADFPWNSVVDRVALADAIARMLVLVKGERFPLVRLTLTEGAVGLLMDVPEVGLMEDEIEAEGGPEQTFEIWFTPQNLVGGLGASGRNNVTLAYGPNAMKSLSITDDDGYRCDVMPRHVVDGKKAAVPKADA